MKRLVNLFTLLFAITLSAAAGHNETTTLEFNELTGTFTSDSGQLPILDTDYDWDSATKTLTFMEDFVWRSEAEIAFRITAKDITISIASGKTVTFTSTCKQAGSDPHGIWAEGDLTIEGAGTLNATSKPMPYDNSYSLFSNGNITITSGTVIATSESVPNSNSYNLFAYGNITITGGTVIATSGTTTNSNSFGIITSSNIIITGGMVEATGKEEALSAEAVIMPTLPYWYWTNTATSAPGGAATANTEIPFVNNPTYKYVKITTTQPVPPTPEPEPEPDLELAPTSEAGQEIALEVLSDSLTVRISNPGTEATGTISLYLSGNHADAFTLDEKQIFGVAPDAYTDIMLKLADGLAPGTYTATLTVTDHIVSATTDIIYTVTSPVANKQIETTTLRAYVQNGTLHISGLTAGDTWRLYTITGTLIKTAIAEDDKGILSLPARGAYIIATAKGTMKVVW